MTLISSFAKNSLIPFLLLVMTCGCMTSAVMDKARPVEKWNSETKETEKTPGESAYYAILPLSIAGDLATSPFQLMVVVAFMIVTKGGGH